MLQLGSFHRLLAWSKQSPSAIDLIKIFDLVPFATATTIEHNQIETALVWLEQGRCVIWKQLDQLRTPVHELQAHDPSLAVCFLKIAHDLDTSGFYETKSNFFSEVITDQVIADQDKRQAHVNLAQEWTKLLSEIHHIPGFEHFLQPPNVSDLLAGISSRITTRWSSNHFQYPQRLM
jgi:hypothetical protein